MLGLERYLHECGLEESSLHLIKLRASQINGCAFCLDIHWKDLKSIGEPDHRLYELDAWEETSFYTDRERAALAWTDTVTKIAETMSRMTYTTKFVSNSAKKSSLISPWPLPQSMRGTD